MTGQGSLQKIVLFSDTFAWSITPTKKRGKEKAEAEAGAMSVGRHSGPLIVVMVVRSYYLYLHRDQST